jgi:hypothetical protein
MIEPLVRGTYDGAIVFTVKSRSGCIRPQSDGGSEEHLWYQINVTVDPAEPVEVYNLTAPVFSSNTLDISISNYFTEPATLQAVVEGTYLTGPDELIVDKESQSLYRVEYSPLMLSRERARVVFMGRHDGEMTIEIELESFSPKPVELDPPQCELGKSVYTTLSLNNPLDSEVILTYTQTDPHFTVVGLDNGTLVLPPQSNSNVSVMFKPSQLGYNHETTLTFTSNEFGQQDFTANGEGLPPSPLPLTVISSTLNENSITMLSFTNPLSQPTNFDISLAADSDNFCIFLKQSHNICLHPNVSLDIPVMYGPDAVRMSRAEISVTARGTSDESLTWVYPILGQPEIIASSGFDFAVRAKERKEEKLVVQLEQDNGGSYTSGSMMLSDGSSDDITDNNIKDKYTYQLVSSGDNEGILQLSTGLKLIKEKVFDQMVELEFGLVFLPPKPFSCVCELHVQPHGYGLWRFPVTLTGTDPSPDDVIVLQAQHLTKEIKKGFRLTSLTNQPTPFRASLVTSTPELSFTPVAGVLPPEHQKGQLFTVTYQPRSFNKNCNGRLIIETPSSCWSYEVIGKPLTPVNASVQAKVDHIRHVVVPSSSKRNFIRQNVQQLTQTY